MADKSAEDLTVKQLNELVYVLMDAARSGVKASKDCFTRATMSGRVDKDCETLTTAGAQALTAATAAGEAGVSLLRELRMRSNVKP